MSTKCGNPSSAKRIVLSLSSSGGGGTNIGRNTNPTQNAVKNTSLKTKYKLCDFNDVIFSGFNLTLPAETIKMIEDLNKKINPNTILKPPTFHKKDFSSSSAVQKDLDWDNIHNNKVPVQSNLNNIKTLLNKITHATYLENVNEIIAIMKNCKKTELNDNCKAIFTIASNNRFFSSLYADLISLLIKEFSYMKEIFDTTLQQYLPLFDNIEYIDPDEDYDKFCDINLNNEMRKSYSLFLVNLSKNGNYSHSSLYSLINTLTEKLKLLISHKEKRNEIDEIIENLSILYDKSLLCWFIEEDDSIDEYFKLLSTKFKDADYLGISSKSYFKICEIVANN
jgi:hypothetical protein